jgi:hypothetical protein
VEEGDERGHGCLIGETEGGGLSVNEHKIEGEAELGVWRQWRRLSIM